MNEKMRVGGREMGKVVGLLLGASLIVMLTMSLMFTSTVEAKQFCCECWDHYSDTGIHLYDD